MQQNQPQSRGSDSGVTREAAGLERAAAWRFRGELCIRLKRSYSAAVLYLNAAAPREAAPALRRHCQSFDLADCAMLSPSACQPRQKSCRSVRTTSTSSNFRRGAEFWGHAGRQKTLTDLRWEISACGYVECQYARLNL